MSKKIIKQMNQVLADTYALYMKTQVYHWNVVDKNFKSLHVFFEEIYGDLNTAIDEIAEHIRSLDAFPEASFKTFDKATKIKEAKKNATAPAMVKDLMQSQETISKTLTSALKAAEKEDDVVVVDYLTQRLAAHRKHRWMLKSSM